MVSLVNNSVDVDPVDSLSYNADQRALHDAGGRIPMPPESAIVERIEQPAARAKLIHLR